MKRYHALVYDLCKSEERQRRKAEAQAAVRAERAQGPPAVLEQPGYKTYA